MVRLDKSVLCLYVTSLIIIDAFSLSDSKHSIVKRREPNSVQCFKNEDCMSDCCISTNGKTGLCVGKPQVGQICGLFIALPPQWNGASETNNNSPPQIQTAINLGRFSEQPESNMNQNFGGNFGGSNQFGNFQMSQMQQSNNMRSLPFFNSNNNNNNNNNNNFNGFYQSNQQGMNSQFGNQQGFGQNVGNFFGQGKRSTKA